MDMKKPNILFYFTDQQRWDTIGCYGQPLPVTPVLDDLAKEGVIFDEAYTAQPVCGPCRSIFQTGLYPTETGCYKNGISLPVDTKTVADYMYQAGYDCAYIGKWHLASDDKESPKPEADYTMTAIPPEKRGGYKGFWRVSDILEFTSHGYDGYVFDENMNKCEFKGYRADKMTDFALEYLDQHETGKPFFMTISHIEPHHQNDRQRYEGPEGSKEKFKDFILPKDLEILGGNAKDQYPDYLGCCNSLDSNLGRIIAKLKETGQYENTIIIYSSDHGSHFQTRNNDENLNGGDDYKRSCHSASLRVPLIIAGPGFKGGRRVEDLVSTISLPKTFLNMAGIDVGGQMAGENLKDVLDGTSKNRDNLIFAQISESRVSRVVRTKDYLFSVYAPGKNGFEYPDSDTYAPDFLYDLNNDPYELNNLVAHEDYEDIRKQMIELLKREMQKAGEKRPVILPNH